MQRIRIVLKTLVFFCLLSAAPTHLAAQAPSVVQQVDNQNAVIAAVEALQEQVKSELGKAAQSLEKLRKEVDAAAAADAQLAQLKLKADSIGKTISNAMGALENRYNLVAKRLEELGQPPADGQQGEDPGVSGDRKRLQGEKAQMNTILSDGEVLNTEADKLSSHITDLRRKLFAETLFRRTLVTPEILEETGAAARSETDELVAKTASSLSFMWNFKRGGLFAALFLSLVAAVVLMLLVRSAFAPLIRRESLQNNPPYITRLSKAFWSTLVPSIAVAAFVSTSIFFLDYFKVLRDDISQIFQAFLWVCAVIYFVFKLTRTIVAPGKPAWRLINVSDRGARTLVTFAILMALVNGIAFLTGEITEALDSPVVLSVAKGFISSILIGALLIILSFMRPMQPFEPGEADRPWPLVIRIIFVVTGIGLILTALIGYIGLAQFAATQIVVSGAIAVTMYIGFLTGHAISRPDALGATVAGRALQKRHGLTNVQLDQLALVAGLATYVLVAVLFIPPIMLQWGFQGADIWSLFVRLFTEIHVGNITISLLGILAGMLVFVLGYFVTRWFQRWLDINVMARSQVDTGVRNSVNTALGYAGIAIAGIIGVSAAGINLSSLALVAGALSLGIGFGLQTIVQNFVSGLILLAERPFKVGDWIVAAPIEGFVRRISVRATEIETFRNQSVIVPNSQLINASVGNWTLRNKLGRSEIAVSVSYDSDPRQVMDILVEIARNQPLVLTMPEPHVEFVRFGESSLDFELRFYLADLFTGLGVRNAIRIEILERFREEGILMPFPQRTINVRYSDEKAMMADALHADGVPGEEARKLKQELDRRRVKAEASARDIDTMEDDRHSHDRYEHDEDDDSTR